MTRGCLYHVRKDKISEGSKENDNRLQRSGGFCSPTLGRLNLVRDNPTP